jgi:mannose-6-phosphate isomerase-like protein (cupin superfamily)
MSTVAVDLVFNNFVRAAHRESERTSVLRVALLHGEMLRVPRSSDRLRILSGSAWVTFGGKDFLLESGEQLTLPKTRYGAVISAVGGDALLFEV